MNRVRGRVCVCVSVSLDAAVISLIKAGRHFLRSRRVENKRHKKLFSPLTGSTQYCSSPGGADARQVPPVETIGKGKKNKVSSSTFSIGFASTCRCVKYTVHCGHVNDCTQSDGAQFPFGFRRRFHCESFTADTACIIQSGAVSSISCASLPITVVNCTFR